MSALLEARDLHKTFQTRAGNRIALEGVSLALSVGETLGLVGESGSGKSTLGRCLLGLVTPDSGEVVFEGTRLSGLSARAWLPWRRKLQIVFQDPYSSLSPRLPVGYQIEEPLIAHRLRRTRAEREARVVELLGWVGLEPELRERYPHELSGGQRQRVAIARALSVEPRALVCDEPLSALDLTTQVAFLDLFRDLQKRLGLSYLFISHDLRLVAALSHRIAVLCAGKIVETGPALQVYSQPTQLYTQALVAAIPHLP